MAYFFIKNKIFLIKIVKPLLFNNFFGNIYIAREFCILL